MIEIGRINKLRIVKEVEFGLYLDGEEQGEILIPKRYVPSGVKPDDLIDVFIYHDSEDRIIATTEKPHAMVGEFAYMKVVSVNQVGAFLDWGLMKDLMVPFREQKKDMQEGNSYLVYLYLDATTHRIAASAKLDKFLDNVPADYDEGQEVDLIIANPSDIGYNVIVNGLHRGILYKNEVFQPLHTGQKIKGYIKKIREDEKLDISLTPMGYEKIDDISQLILQRLEDNGGYLKTTDKSPAEMIYDIFGISKKNYKKAVGSLYKRRLLEIEDEGIRLITDADAE